MEIEGYSQTLLFALLGLGIPLAVLRPYVAFLLAVFLLTAGDVDRFNHTRTTFLGPYLNLADICVLIAVMGLFFDKLSRKESLRVPTVVSGMIFVVTLAACQSLWKFGGSYETLRVTRWAIQFPVCFFIGANLVTSANRVEQLVKTLLWGAAFSALQHMWFMADLWQTRSFGLADYHLIRTISYWGGCIGSAFLVSSTFWKWPPQFWRKMLYGMIGLLLLGSIILNMTRSLWIGTACAVPCSLLVFRGKSISMTMIRLGVTAVFVLFIMGWLCQYAMPGVDVFHILSDRVVELLDPSNRDSHVGTRGRAFYAEMGSWMRGTMVFGRGLAFFQTIDNTNTMNFKIAFNHLGYVTYLSQMGLIGLLVYGFYLPFGVIRDARWLWNRAESEVFRYAGLLGGASILCLSIMFVMSSHFMILGYEGPAVLYGGIWALARSKEIETVGLALPA